MTAGSARSPVTPRHARVAEVRRRDDVEQHELADRSRAAPRGVGQRARASRSVRARRTPRNPAPPVITMRMVGTSGGDRWRYDSGPARRTPAVPDQSEESAMPRPGPCSKSRRIDPERRDQVLSRIVRLGVRASGRVSRYWLIKTGEKGTPGIDGGLAAAQEGRRRPRSSAVSNSLRLHDGCRELRREPRHRVTELGGLDRDCRRCPCTTVGCAAPTARTRRGTSSGSCTFDPCNAKCEHEVLPGERCDRARRCRRAG